MILMLLLCCYHKDEVTQPDMVCPRVVEAKGRNPEQYPDYKEWDE